jgi:hypothetical protein
MTRGPATLEQRIARLEAVEAIKQLKASYFQACDDKRPDLVRECFAEGEIDLDYGRIGCFDDREQLVEVFERLACQPHIVEMHHGQNPRVEVLDEFTARGAWGLYYYLIDTRQHVITQLGGRYDDAFVLQAGQWRICRSHYVVTSSQILDWSEGLARVIFAGSSAPVELDDPGRQAG